MKLFQVVYLFVGTAAVLGNQPADDIPKYTVTVQVTGPPWEQGLTIAIAKEGKVKTELARNVRVRLFGQMKGELTHVGTPSDTYNACSYKAGDIYTSCFIGKHQVIFQSKAEVQNTLKIMLLVTRKGQGNEPPFEVKIDNVVKVTEYGPIHQDTTWWRMFDVDGAGSIVN